MVVCPSQHDTSARAATRRAVSTLALQCLSSLKVRHRRYNAHMRKVNALPQQAEITPQLNQEVRS